MIIKSVRELLYNHECVIIPEFGAFITKYVPAKIDSVTHRFTPPSKEMVFNSFLDNDDSLLVDYISLKNKVTKEEAKSSVHNFVVDMTRLLHDDKKVDFDGIGTLSIDSDDSYVFKSAEDVNFLGDAFGLTSFTMLPVFRIENVATINNADSQQESEDENIFTFESVDNNTRERGRFRWLRPIGYAAAACAMLFALCWGVEESSSNLAGWNILSFSSPNRFLAHHYNNNTVDIQTDDVVKMNDAILKYVKKPVVLPEVEVSSEVVDNNEVVEIFETEVMPEIIENNEVLSVPEVEVSSEVVENKEVAVVPEVEIPEPKVQESVVIEKNNHYFVIAGAFLERSRAERCLADIDKNVFSTAEILDVNSKGFWRVAYSASPDKKTAMSFLEKAKEYDSEAWLLYIK